MPFPRARWLLLLVWLCASAALAAPVDKPNLVLIIGDDVGYPYAGFMGDLIVKTPHLDRLAQEGTVFSTGYVTASGCQPSLLSLLTGLHPARRDALLQALGPEHGRPSADAKHRETLPALLAKRGYASFQAGKLWEGTYATAGFTEGTKTVDRPGRDLVSWMGGREGMEIGRSTMQPVFDFIDRHPETPFFLWFAPKLPHTPWDAPPQFHQPYREMGLTRNAEDYYANVTRLDAAVGELLAHLDARGLRSRTLVVYLSDNGWVQEPFEDYGRGQRTGPGGKGWMNELGFRTPIVFQWKGQVPAGVTRDELVSSLDLFPTLLDYAGVPVPDDRTGVDLRPLIEGRTDQAPHAALVGSMENAKPHFDDPTASGPKFVPAYFVRTPRWHYIWYPQQGDDQLYDMQADPREKQNVIARHPELIAGFRRQIKEWEEGIRALPEGS